MGNYLLSQVHNEHLSIFLGFWSTLTNALFAYIGTELIGVTMGEAANPRKAIPKAIRRTFWRIVVLYVGSVFVIRFGSLLFEVFCRLTLRCNFDSLVVPSTNNVGASLHRLHIVLLIIAVASFRLYLLPISRRQALWRPHLLLVRGLTAFRRNTS